MADTLQDYEVSADRYRNQQLNQYLDSLDESATKYQSRPDADWGDIKEALGDDLIDTVSESLGPDAFPSKDWPEKWHAHCKTIFQLVSEYSISTERLALKSKFAIWVIRKVAPQILIDANIGSLTRKLSTPYIIRCAQRRLETRARVKSDIDDLLTALGGE